MKIVIIEGSLREQSLSKLGGSIARQELQRLGVEVDTVRSQEIEELPFYGSKNRQPKMLEALRTRLQNADAFIWTVPVYCGSVSGAVKNFLDHFSRTFDRKWFFIVGAAGSDRSMFALREFREALIVESNALAIPRWILLTEKDLDGQDGSLQGLAKASVESLTQTLVQCVTALPRLPTPPLPGELLS